jgi:hypothetical protein|tara:strand:+ start:13065 stop:14225 length:1161 start_codon:yes stop_codon:yes gene_type:complete
VVYVGNVISKKDILGKGSLTVCPKGLDEKDPNNWIDVKYTSFYSAGTNSAAVFLPETNTEILYDIAKNDADKTYYFVSCIITPNVDKAQVLQPETSDKNPELGGENTYPHDPEDGKYNNQSMSYGISTPLGHSILMLEGRDESSDNTGIRISSAKGHAVVLDDSAETQKAVFKSKDQGASLTLTDLKSEEPIVGPEGAYLKAIGNTYVESAEGDLVLRVQDGRNLKIHNKATGSHGDPLPATKRSSFGNIEIATSRGDISIVSRGNGVFIDCLGGDKSTGETGATFQVRSNNKISLYSENGIDIKSLGDVNIKGRNVNIQSDTATQGKIQLNPVVPLDLSMGIRKTNQETDFENFFGVFPFFFNPLWSPNYTVGPNTDGRLGGPLP